jgi:hypothetical protein
MIMAGTGKKWFVGCGIGCGLMLLILGGVGTCGYFGFKKLEEKIDGLEENSDAIQARFGDPADFVPALDGSVPADRMETFLAVRDEMTSYRLETSEILNSLDDSGLNWIAKAQAGMKLVPALLGFINQRNEALLNQGMGVGEYQYIYALSYFVLLAEDPADGPSFTLSGDDEADNGNVKFNWGNSNDHGDVREDRSRRVRRFVNNVQVDVLENQLDAYQASLPAGTDASVDPWGAQLTAEVEALKFETLRFPWEDDLPQQIRASLEPYRDRLVATYDPLTSVIEMGMTDDD